MNTGLAALTDVQRLTLASGEALAKELGLKNLNHREVPVENIEFSEGQTVVIANPYGLNVGVIRVSVGEFNGTRYTNYFLNNDRILQKTERFRNHTWVPLFTPEFDLRLSPQSVLYAS